MTDAAWIEGMKQLAFLPDPVTDLEIRAERSALYRQELDELNDAAWLHAAKLAFRHEKWFPTVASLLEYAESYRPALKALPARTEEQREADRETCRKGLELIKAAVANAPAEVLRVVTPEPPSKVVHATDERLEALRAQAREIVAK